MLAKVVRFIGLALGSVVLLLVLLFGGVAGYGHDADRGAEKAATERNRLVVHCEQAAATAPA